MLWAAVDVKDKTCIAEIVEEGEQMRYLSAAVMAEKWHVSERSVRNYCAKGRVTGAVLVGRTWNIPENAEKRNASTRERNSRLPCWMFFKHRRQADAPVVSITGHRLI